MDDATPMHDPYQADARNTGFTHIDIKTTVSIKVCEKHAFHVQRSDL
ncbi:hypothetical protein PAMC26577_08445 [Caballeronia sordidicola]|uniref:Uncharacterized protein n=1 Tax=Caballeronia sordidicola TaxID=196367 RepID=A0A242N0S3_CABSO|nr:hypothetical protein PAMC26577_08445 [Caballeronia sordidicola]